MSTAFSAAEEKLVSLVRQLPLAAAEEVHDFAAFLVARHCDWSYGEEASIQRAVDLMASDHFVLRETRAVIEDFACAEGDGLEAYP